MSVSFNQERQIWNMYPGKTAQQIASTLGIPFKDVCDCLGKIDLLFDDSQEEDPLMGQPRMTKEEYEEEFGK